MNPDMMSDVKEEDNIINIGKMLTKIAKDQKILPKFVIYHPHEVPAPSELTGVYVVSRNSRNGQES